MQLTSRHRTVLGIALFLPLAAVVITLFACLDAPIGDPETAKIDEKLTGAWQVVPAADADKDDATLVTLRPWDQHTWFVQYMTTTKKDNEEKSSVLNYKGWLAKIADADFIVLESLDEFLSPLEHDRYYWIARITVKKDDAVTVRRVDNKSDFVNDLNTREKLEAAIKDHLNDDKLYDESTTLKKLSGDDLKKVQDMRKKLHMGVSHSE